MRILEGRPADETGRGIERPGQRVDGGDLDGMLVVQIRQQPWEPCGEHGLARAGWADEEQVVAARSSHLERVARGALPDDVDEIEVRRGPASRGQPQRKHCSCLDHGSILLRVS